MLFEGACVIRGHVEEQCESMYKYDTKHEPRKVNVLEDEMSHLPLPEAIAVEQIYSGTGCLPSLANEDLVLEKTKSDAFNLNSHSYKHNFAPVSCQFSLLLET